MRTATIPLHSDGCITCARKYQYRCGQTTIALMVRIRDIDWLESSQADQKL